MAGRRVIAKKLGVSVARIRQLIQAGVLPDKPKGEHDPEECLALYIRRLRETAAGTDGNLPKNSGLREIQRQRDEVELDLARLALAAARGEIIPVEAVRPVVERAYVGLRANLISLGGRIADQVLSFNTPAAAQELIDGEIEAALAEVKSIFSSTDWVKAAVAAAPRRPGRKTKAEIMLRQQVTNGQDGQHS